MIIRPLQPEEYNQAVDLKISCWDEELAGVAPNRRVKGEELTFITSWVAAARENDDIRLVYGAFDCGEFLGFAGASIAEPSDAGHGVELNYLYVKQGHRGRGVALRLMEALLAEFNGQGFDQLIVYNHHLAPSNSFYRKLGGKVMRQDIQGTPPDRLKIDVLVFDFQGVKDEIERLMQVKPAR
jgi:GNAT superfamily N-acetyltransferase